MKPETLNRRILIVDDNPKIHEDVRKVFRERSVASVELDELESGLFGGSAPGPGQQSFEIDSAYQGEEGLAMVRRALDDERPYALAFVDMRMPPGWDGLTTIHHLWGADPALQIVICTAFSDVSWSTLADQLGHSDGLLVLKKPFDHIEVTQMAHALTEKWSLSRALQDRLDQLELRVQERTGQLERTNIQLQHELVEKQQMQAELQMAARLATMGTLAAGVAHEINNPLSFIIANLDYLQASVTSLRGACPNYQQAADLEEALCDARHGADRVRRIVADMKTLSRVDEETRPVDLRRVIEAALNLASQDLRGRARLVTQFEPVLPVQGNEGRFGQVFLNLIVNAIQAIAPGNPATNELRISLGTDAAGRVVAEIADTGTGIPPEVLPRIFDPFFTTKEPGMGTGLGLSICRSIVSGAGGLIEVTSQPGRGTSFRILFPSGLPEHAPTLPPSLPPSLPPPLPPSLPPLRLASGS